VAFSARFGIRAVAWGVFASGILQVVVMLPFMKGWFSYMPVLDVNDARFRKLVTLAGPALLSMGISEINHMIDHALASGLNSGDISAMSYAYRLITFLLGVLMVPLTTIMFSKMSRMAAAKDVDGILDALRKSVCVICMVVFPIVAIAVVMNIDVIKFAYMRGAFGMDSVIVTSGILVCYVIGVPAFGLRDFLNRLFHSLQDTKTPFRIACLVVGLKIVLNVFLRGPLGANGLALATSIAGTTGLMTMFLILRKRFGSLGFKSVLSDFTGIVAATLVCAAVCIGMNSILPEAFGTMRVFVRLAITSAVSLIIYAAACYIFGVKMFRQFVGGLLRRIRR
jgi:putative peptidoglycan lipid II flippase